MKYELASPPPVSSQTIVQNPFSINSQPGTMSFRASAAFTPTSAAAVEEENKDDDVQTTPHTQGD